MTPTLENIAKIEAGAKVKEIGWAYPSSDDAKLFGYAEKGCYVLRTGAWLGPMESIAGCAGVSPLILMGDTRIEGEWSPHSMF